MVFDESDICIRSEVRALNEDMKRRREERERECD